jgi:hypothetical protein
VAGPTRGREGPGWLVRAGVSGGGLWAEAPLIVGGPARSAETAGIWLSRRCWTTSSARAERSSRTDATSSRSFHRARLTCSCRQRRPRRTSGPAAARDVPAGQGRAPSPRTTATDGASAYVPPFVANSNSAVVGVRCLDLGALMPGVIRRRSGPCAYDPRCEKSLRTRHVRHRASGPALTTDSGWSYGERVRRWIVGETPVWAGRWRGQRGR